MGAQDPPASRCLRCAIPHPATIAARVPRSELARRVEQFVLRRTREVNSRYLPPLSNYVVFCK